MKDIFAPNQRIIILQGLEKDNDYSLSNEILQRLLVMYGHGVGLSAVDEHLDWLAERKLISIDDLENGIRVAKLTRAGVDLARGLTQTEGVERPMPEE